MNRKFRLSNRELDIMNILWSNSNSMTASSICKESNNLNINLSINTVQSALKSLLNKKAIEVDEIVYSGKVLTRSYKATLSISQYVKSNFSSNTFEVTASLINAETDLSKIDELSKLLEEKKASIEKE